MGCLKLVKAATLCVTEVALFHRSSCSRFEVHDLGRRLPCCHRDAVAGAMAGNIKKNSRLSSPDIATHNDRPHIVDDAPTGAITIAAQCARHNDVSWPRSRTRP